MALLSAALALAVTTAPAPQPASAQHHTFAGLAIAPQGDRIATLEADEHDSATEIAHKTLVIRDTAKAR